MSNIQTKFCPFIPVCVTPNWYIYSKAIFIKNVCHTEDHKKCIHYSGLEVNVSLKNKKEWERTRKYILNHHLYKDKVKNPSRRY